MRGNGEFRHGLTELRKFPRGAKIQELCASEGQCQRPLRSAQDIRPYPRPSRVITETVRDMPGQKRYALSICDNVELKGREDAIPAASRPKNVRIKYYLHAYTCDTVK